MRQNPFGVLPFIAGVYYYSVKNPKGYTPVKRGLVSVSCGMLIYIGLFSFLPFSINCIGDSEENWVRIRNFDLVHEYEQTLTDEDGETYTENKSFQEDATEPFKLIKLNPSFGFHL
jgi:hypothetical protein